MKRICLRSNLKVRGTVVDTYHVNNVLVYDIIFDDNKNKICTSHPVSHFINEATIEPILNTPSNIQIPDFEFVDRYSGKRYKIKMVPGKAPTIYE